MESLNNNWTISEVSVPCEEPRRKTKASSNPKKRSEKPSRRNKTKKVYTYKRTYMRTQSSWLLLVGAIIFLLCVGVLFQQSVISQLNDDVRTMQAQLDEKIAMNDSKSGELIANSDWDSIEATARSYGMKELTPSQYAYETGMEDQQASVVAQKDESWLSTIFK